MERPSLRNARTGAPIKAMLDKILTKQTFTQLVEKYVHEQGLTYMEAILQICEERGIDPLDVGKMIVPAIKSKVEAEAMNKNLLPKSNTLSFD
jgi:hypothetical protein